MTVVDNTIPSLPEQVTNTLVKGLMQKLDEIIAEAYKGKGLDINNDQVKKDSIIIDDGVYYNYWYKHGTPEALRIISIKKQKDITFSYGEDFMSNNFTQKVEVKYY